MEKLTILTADLLDIIFEYRNKKYGAYELRRTYPKRMAYALAATFFTCLLFVAGTIIANPKHGSSRVELAVDYELNSYAQDPPPPPPPPPLPKIEPPRIETSQFNPPRIVPDDQVKPEDEIADVDKLEDTKIGSVNQDGIKGNDIVDPPVEKIAPIVARPGTEEPGGFIPVQFAADFPGGTEGWTKYLRKNLNSDIPSQNGAPVGKYTVVISFVVSADGAISDVQAENDPGYGTKAEAIRVIVKGPHWNPAVQNGRKVVYRHKQSITFQVAEE